MFWAKALGQARAAARRAERRLKRFRWFKPADAEAEDFPERRAAEPPAPGDVPEPPGDVPAPAGAASDGRGESPPWHVLSARVDLLAERLELYRAARELDLARLRKHQPAPALDLEDLGRRVQRLEARDAAAAALPVTLRPPPLPKEFKAPSGTGALAPTPPEFAIPGPSVSGALDDLAFATLLEILELDVRRGAVVRARLDGNATDVVAALREAFRWQNAQFALRRASVISDSDAPRSVNELLLELAREHDEAARAG
jgi:hypothetical protein